MSRFVKQGIHLNWIEREAMFKMLDTSVVKEIYDLFKVERLGMNRIKQRYYNELCQTASFLYKREILEKLSKKHGAYLRDTVYQICSRLTTPHFAVVLNIVNEERRFMQHRY